MILDRALFNEWEEKCPKLQGQQLQTLHVAQIWRWLKIHFYEDKYEKELVHILEIHEEKMKKKKYTTSPLPKNWKGGGGGFRN